MARQRGDLHDPVLEGLLGHPERALTSIGGVRVLDLGGQPEGLGAQHQRGTVTRGGPQLEVGAGEPDVVLDLGCERLGLLGGEVAARTAVDDLPRVAILLDRGEVSPVGKVAGEISSPSPESLEGAAPV